MIKVQAENFSVDAEYQALQIPDKTGAVVIFVGLVRDFAHESKDFQLQHYPGMTEKVLSEIEAQAQQRWHLLRVTIIHRVGPLNIDDQIVFVGVSAAHRKQAFAAAEFIIDILKTQAPFWKKEGGKWVDAKEDDQEAAEKWLRG